MGLFGFLKKDNKKDEAESRASAIEPKTSKLDNDLRETAENFSKNFSNRFDLDFSCNSLSKVNELLDEVNDFVEDEDRKNDIMTMAGAYVFEVAKRNFGGKYYWIESEQQPILIAGEPDYSVSIKAWDKVKKYMENGSEDDQKYYIDGYKEYIEKGKKNKGYSAQII